MGTIRFVRRAVIAAAIVASLAVQSVRADISENQVLVVYNSASADGTALRTAYLAAHPGIPTTNILDLNDASLLVPDLTYANFVSKLRTPIRNHLNATGTAQSIVAIALLRPIPHRIQDTDNPTVGDAPSAAVNELSAGDATYASVDTELALLWQNLDTGEAGGTMDSLSDNMIVNPYHTSTVGIDAFSRANITTAKTFANLGNAAWG
ncbi:MAG TPA: hypothetical protein P5572_17330, partial [Phycisphaerae bacterium]|nr:hypothetical protein [Phycisphaerae bacterium]